MLTHYIHGLGLGMKIHDLSKRSSITAFKLNITSKCFTA